MSGSTGETVSAWVRASFELKFSRDGSVMEKHRVSSACMPRHWASRVLKQERGEGLNRDAPRILTIRFDILYAGQGALHAQGLQEELDKDQISSDHCSTHVDNTRSALLV
uniref:Uncharacterized protein n=1 Tax=Coccidioides posadasii RMSCC 3488 TaxID=454284 RepID=A0A0J6FB07_COCPO|nr:hypothetical protein CPAG_06508 [Coccidioides posadasii RMSCC 3488]